jgi:YD repeat-containing protein
MRLLLLAVLALAPAAFAQSFPIECGTTVGGTFAQGVIESYSFLADGPDAIVIRGAISSEDSTFAVTVTLHDTAGRQVLPRRTGFLLNNVIGEFDLPASGYYLIRVQSLNILTPGAYKISFTYLNRPCNSGTLTCGVSLSDSFAQVIQMKTYQFAANAGDVLSLRVVKTPPFTAGSSLAAAVYSASGHLLANATQTATLALGSNGSGSIAFPVTDTGPVTVLVFDRGTGALQNNYSLAMVRLNGPCGGGSGLTCGAVLQGGIRGAFGIDTYTAQLQAGDVVSIRTAGVDASGALRPVSEIYDSQGRPVVTSASVLSSARPLVLTNFTAPADGAYYVLVHDNGNGANTGTYAITLVRLNRPCGAGVSLSCGSIVDGSLKNLMASNLYTLPVAAGDTYMLWMLHNDQNASFKPRVDIYDERGNAIDSLTINDIGSRKFRAPSTGSYTLFVIDSYDYSQTGTYTLALQRLNRPCNAMPLSCGTPVTGTFARAPAPAVFTYDSPPGQSFTLRMLDNTGTLLPALSVFDAAGNGVGSPLPGGQPGVDVVNGAGGLYTVVAADGSAHPTGAPFTVDLLRTSNACGATPSKGQTVRSLITPQAPYQVYSLPLQAGDALSVRSASQTAGFSAQMELYDPSGARVDSQTFALSRRTAADGAYTVIVGPSAPRTGGAFVLSWQTLNSPGGTEALLCGGTVTASLGTASEFRYYSLAADAADMLRLLFTRTSDNFAPQMELFDPAGNRLAGGSDISQRAASPGTYLALVSPSTSNAETGSFALGFQRPNHPCNTVAVACGATTLRQVLVPGQLDTFTFTGTPGDQANIRLTQRSGSYVPVVDLYDAAGTRVGTSSSGALLAALPSNGPYLLLVHDRQGTSLGSYRVSVQDNTNACTVDDKEPPTVSLLQPTGGEVIAGASTVRIQWQSDDNVGVAAHQLDLSTDGGKTFASAIASNVSGVSQSFVWSVPADIAPSRNAILRITAADAAGNSQSSMSAPLSIIGSGFTPTSTTNFTYDALNRVIQVTSGDGRIVQYVWDAAGNLIQIVVP